MERARDDAQRHEGGPDRRVHGTTPVWNSAPPCAKSARIACAKGEEGDLTAVQSGELQARIRALLPYFYSPFDFGGMVTRPPRVHRRFRRRLRLLRIPAD